MTSRSSQILPAAERERWQELRRIVDYAVRRYTKRAFISPSEAEDMRQDGYIAACKAVQSFDPTKGKLSTWVMKRVNGELIDSLAKLRSSGITGADKPERISFDAALGTDDGEESDIPGASAPESLALADILLDPSQDSASSGTSYKTANDVLECMDSTDRTLIREYYGLDGTPHTYEQLGAQYGLAPKSVRYRLLRALERSRGCLKALAARRITAAVG